MKPIQLLMTYIVTLVIFLGFDSIWLSLAAPRLYKHYIGHLMADKPNITAAAIFYLLFVVGLLAFVIIPALDKGSLKHATVYGALFGLITYATFDLTAQAVFKKWPTAITIIDLCWGVILSIVVSTVSYSIAHAFIKK